jgi:cytidine deaminase
MSGPTSDDRSRSPRRRSLGRPPERAERLLFEEALTAAEKAYAPYSGYALGAVAVGPSGRHYLGVNVESAAYPAGLCAERAALAALVTNGEREPRVVAVAALDGSDCLPCGLCLQALAEFGDPQLVVRRGGGLAVVRLRELLTTPFAQPDEVADA